MDIAVLSDIHANHVALQACFEYCISKGITNYVLLGDYVTDGPFPEKTMETLYMLRQHFNCTFIRGNREQYLLDFRARGETGWKPGSASGALLYTYEHLTVRDLNFFDSMPIYTEWRQTGYPSFELCHGSPSDVSEILKKDGRNTRKVLSQLKTELLLHGHFHVQESFELRGKRCVNPGSVGIPWYHGGKTQMAVLHGDGREWVVELKQLEYDREALVKSFEESGIMEKAPAWCAVTLHTIRTGIDLNETVLLRAMQLCREDRGTASWPDIPEIYWAFALRENKIDLMGNEMEEKKEA